MRNGHRKPWGASLFVSAVVALALLIFYLVFKSYIDMFGTHKINDAAAWGQFGDFVGGLTNPILSFLGLLVLLQTFRFQIEASARQIEVSEIEKFENTFFKLVDKFDKQAASIFRGAKNENYNKTLRSKLLSEKERLSTQDWAEGLAHAGVHVRKVIESDNDRLGSFGRKFSQCLYFIDNSSLTHDKKEFYFTYALESFMKHEMTIYMAIVFARSPKSVEIIRRYKLASRLKDSAFCCNQVRELYSGKDYDGAYPLQKAKSADEDLKSDAL
ncbi:MULTISPECIES: hypothetical protein [unclassified Pseudomonas]|uniref:hypothetical protein n=1 Tax=unclassified Pseudomonas TaxID=196821 RepID=UPI000D37EC93|nr:MULTISPECIES: hypothetical protein [unclassified Pseudomonas]RAU43473.1 hypothetical protein DBP26_019945 [Pseudomonas sp. RIT 409]RAU49990.1 hypothetical protein DBY65_022840 [Pseudomonas sp. RIT 412]